MHMGMSQNTFLTEFSGKMPPTPDTMSTNQRALAQTRRTLSAATLLKWKWKGPKVELSLALEFEQESYSFAQGRLWLVHGISMDFPYWTIISVANPQCTSKGGQSSTIIPQQRNKEQCSCFNNLWISMGQLVLYSNQGRMLLILIIVNLTYPHFETGWLFPFPLFLALPVVL